MKLKLLFLLGVVLLLTACGPTVKESATVANYSNLSNSSNYLSKPAVIPEPTVEPTPVVVSFPARVSFYSNSVEEGTNGRTALGQPTSRGMVAVAYTLDERGRAIPVIPFGEQVKLEGLGVYTVADTCPACEENWFDVFEPDRATAFRLGVRVVTATLTTKNARD